MERTLGAFSRRPTTLEVRFGLERLEEAEEEVEAAMRDGRS